MEKIIDFIWWVFAIAALPLDGYFIMDCIAKNNFDLRTYSSQKFRNFVHKNL